MWRLTISSMTEWRISVTVDASSSAAMYSLRWLKTALRWSFITSSYLRTFLRRSKLRAQPFLAVSMALFTPWMGDGLALLQPELGQHAIHAVGPEDPHQIVFERQEEAAAARSP